ncbi:hypothetical protein D8Y23_01585 [Microbacterium enclense]|uniref:Uncharacterized protein n=1 Tax=Microbacterium enclense TaxID=993073 RepID=A0A3S3LIG0_9MICO|nr:hypothetical protein [Microbacterium enclense]RWR22673.1 hypothetical protein D8Y23_01585 [Microbacterium enclense]
MWDTASLRGLIGRGPASMSHFVQKQAVRVARSGTRPRKRLLLPRAAIGYIIHEWRPRHSGDPWRAAMLG